MIASKGDQGAAYLHVIVAVAQIPAPSFARAPKPDNLSADGGRKHNKVEATPPNAARSAGVLPSGTHVQDCLPHHCLTFAAPAFELHAWTLCLPGQPLQH